MLHALFSINHKFIIFRTNNIFIAISYNSCANALTYAASLSAIYLYNVQRDTYSYMSRHKMRLYRQKAGSNSTYPNLTSLLSAFTCMHLVESL